MSSRDFYNGLEPEVVREEKIEYYQLKKQYRDEAYTMMELFPDDAEVIEVNKADLARMDKELDLYNEVEVDWTLIDRISYDEIGDYIDRGLLP